MTARRRTPSRPRPPCEVCGEPLSLGGTFCPACGYDPGAPEADPDVPDGLDLPDADLDYDEFLRREGLAGEAGTRRLPRGRALFLWLAAAIALVAFLLQLILGGGWG